jgi:hypothetical protein
MAYSIPLLLDSDAYVGTVNVSALPKDSVTEEERGQPAKEHDVVFLFNVRGGTDIKDIQEIEVNNRPWILDREKKPVVWLGRANEQESMQLLLDLYPQVGARKLKASIMVGAELHNNPVVIEQLAVALSREIYSGTDVKLQVDILDVISHLPHGLSTTLLTEIAHNHPNGKVREEALDYLKGSTDRQANKKTP